MNPSTPWHMWGSTQVAQITANGANRLQSVAVQCANIQYKRPETWRFFFGARISHGSAPAVAPCDLGVLFSVTPGVGRSSFMTPDNLNIIQVPIVDFRFLVPAGTTPGFQNNGIKYTTQGLGPPVDDAFPASGRLIETLVAESLVCSAVAMMFNPLQLAPGTVVTFEMTAYFAPNAHVRPDWFQPLDTRGPHRDPVAQHARDLRFRGNETGGS